MSIVQAEQEKSNEYFGAPNPPTGLTSLGSPTQQTQPKTATQVAFFNVEWHQLGSPDELIILPVCSSCSEPIVDLSMGIAVADFPVEQSFQPAGEVGSRPLRKVPGQIYFCHKIHPDTFKQVVANIFPFADRDLIRVD